MRKWRQNERVQPAPTERTAETDQLVKYTESSTRQRAALLLCLCSLVHVCEGLVLPATFGWSSSRAAPSVQRTWLSVTRTKSPTKAEFECPLYDPPRMTRASGEVRTTTIIPECEVSNDDAEDNHDERQGDENVEEYQDESEETEDIQMKKRTAAAAAALLRRNQVRRRSNKPLKSTSVGTRRVGSASRARNSEGRASKVVNAVRTVAAASAASERTNTTAEAPQREGTHAEQEYGRQCNPINHFHYYGKAKCIEKEVGRRRNIHVNEFFRSANGAPRTTTRSP